MRLLAARAGQQGNHGAGHSWAEFRRLINIDTWEFNYADRWSRRG